MGYFRLLRAAQAHALGTMRFAGIDRPQVARAATLYVGLSYGSLSALHHSTIEGERIGGLLGRRAAGAFSESTVTDEVLRIRGKLGPKQASMTVMGARGVYEGGREDSAVVEIVFLPSPKEHTWRQFRRNIADLAEHLASAFAQQEVLIAWDSGRRRTRQRASPRGLPPPGKRLERWLARWREAAGK